MKNYFSVMLFCLMTYGLMPYAWANGTNGDFKANIRWTAYGIPHIKAKDEHGLGYGIGYVYAKDNACLLIDEILTARGERASYLGAEGESSADLNNITSDFFFSWLNSPQEIEKFWQAQPKPIQQLLLGYAAGFNRFLREANSETMSCFEKQWVSAITYKDLVRLTRRLLVEGGVGQFAEYIVGAKKTQSWWQWLKSIVTNVDTDKSNYEIAQTPWQGDLQLGMGSNAVAVGGQRTDNGKGMLLANPHFPWNGALRFYQMHLTIPGKLDVMGAALPGFPLVNIGFNQNVAWTHTVDTSSHFTLYRLDLDPEDATKYIVDGKTYSMKKKTLQVNVRGDNGKLSVVSHDFYESEFGTLITLPGFLHWDNEHAYAIRDANLDNTRVLKQWYAINQAKDAIALKDSVEELQGIPWVNTVATDNKGKALYMNQSVVPHLLPEQIKTCGIPEIIAEGLPGLKGNTHTCGWHIDSTAVQSGITPATQMASLLRDDFVQNSNDSAWLTNPKSPLVGYSPLVSRQDKSLKIRTRFALNRLQGDGLLTPKYIENMVTDNKVYLADLVLNDLLQLCRQEKEDTSLIKACISLESWDGKANIDSSLGIMYFEFVMDSFDKREKMWRIPFDAKDPLNTPRGLALDEPSVVEGIKDALYEISDIINDFNLPDNARWGDIQLAIRGDEKIPLPGGYGDLGIYNVLEPKRDDYYSDEQAERNVTGMKKGSSYIQLVMFNEEGPEAKGLLASSQSSDILSPFYNDQTKLFSKQYWPIIPFTEAQIKKATVIKQQILMAR
jgi:acyl-homoserine-lactone acylase